MNMTEPYWDSNEEQSPSESHDKDLSRNWRMKQVSTITRPR